MTKVEYQIIQDILLDEDYPEDVAPEGMRLKIDKAPVNCEDDEDSDEILEAVSSVTSGAAEGIFTQDQELKDSRAAPEADQGEEVPAKKRRKVDYGESPLLVYRWKFIDGVSGEVLKVADDFFLDDDQCALDGDDNAPDVVDKCDNVPTLKVMKSRMAQFTTEALVSSVYRYLMNMEYKLRVKQQCYGCQNDKCSQVDHMSGGCLDDRETLVGLHARACHLRISTPRLQLATQAMQVYFPEVKVPYSAFLYILKTVKPERILMNTHTLFFHEYRVLDSM